MNWDNDMAMMIFLQRALNAVADVADVADDWLANNGEVRRYER